jgi:hypothetical protein
VYDDLVVELARQQVMEQLVAEGYSIERDRDGYTIMRHPSPWKGEVRLYDDGWVRIQRQPIQLKPFLGEPGSPLATIGCTLLLPLCVRPGGQLVGRRKLQAVKSEVIGSIDPAVDVWGDRIADRETGDRVEGLSEQLEALWDEGRPLYPGADPYPTYDERRTAILAYWESRTDTVWGDRVRLTVEAFLREVVQHSDHALTEAEIADFNASRRCERALDLTSPWEVVAATVDQRTPPPEAAPR